MNKEILEKSLVAFTDGSSLGNPGPGGWGAVLVSPRMEEIIELGGMKPQTTNNEMELSAIVAVLSHAVNNTEPLHIFTDSQYAINGITKWINGWKQNGWKTKNGDPVKNMFYFKTMDELIRERGTNTVHFHHVSAHVGIPGNERVDDIARWFAEGQDVSLYRGNMADYDIKNILSFEYNAEEKQKRSGKGKSAYSYLSLIDGELQKHTTWTECEARVSGKKAKFKKALNAEHEQEILEEWGLKKED